MTVTQKLFKILSGNDVANGPTDRRTDGQTDGRHTIIRPNFNFGRIKNPVIFPYTHHDTTLRTTDKRAQRALGRSPEKKVKGHSGAIYRGPLMVSTKYW